MAIGGACMGGMDDVGAPHPEQNMVAKS